MKKLDSDWFFDNLPLVLVTVIVGPVLLYGLASIAAIYMGKPGVTVEILLVTTLAVATLVTSVYYAMRVALVRTLAMLVTVPLLSFGAGMLFQSELLIMAAAVTGAVGLLI